MQGKVVVITGATSGIGQVAAERLAGMGVRLMLVWRATRPVVRRCWHGCASALPASRTASTMLISRGLSR